MIHVGIYYFGSKRVACRNDYCTVCREPTLGEGRRSIVVLHLFFVPLLPLGMKTRWFCIACRQETDAKRPSRKGILIAGMGFGGLMALVGVTGMTEGHELLPGLGLVGFGLGLMALLGWMIRSRSFAEYKEWKRMIPPLGTAACPYCEQPVTTVGKTVRCPACDVKLVTRA
jgi:hypothetical protein